MKNNKKIKIDKPDFISHREVLKKALKDPEFKKAYDALEPEYALIRAIIKKRIEEGLTQKKLAKKIGTKQSAISRFESGEYNPTLSFLRKLAEALDVDLKITVK